MQWLSGVPGEEELITERDWHSCITPGWCRSVISRRQCTCMKLHNCHVATTSLTCLLVFIGTACQSELHSRWRCRRTVHCTTILGVVIYVCRQHAAPKKAQVCLQQTFWRSNLPSVNSRRSCFSCCWFKGVERPARRLCHQLRRWQCSRTGSRRTCSAAATKLFDCFLFLVIRPVQYSGPCNSCNCLGHFEMFDDDDDNDDDDSQAYIDSFCTRAIVIHHW